MDYELLKNITGDISTGYGLPQLKETTLTSLGEFTDNSIREMLSKLGCDESVVDRCRQNKDASEFQKYLRQKDIRLVYTEHLQKPSLCGFYFYRNGDSYPCAFISNVSIAHTNKEGGQCIVFEVKTWWL